MKAIKSLTLAVAASLACGVAALPAAASPAATDYCFGSDVTITSAKGADSWSPKGVWITPKGTSPKFTIETKGSVAPR